MKAVNVFACVSILLSLKIFCSGNSLSAEVKDAMVRNHRAHVVKLIPFLDENDIQSATPESSSKKQDSKILISSEENVGESRSSDVTASSEDGEDSVNLSENQQSVTSPVFFFSSPSLLFQMVDSISRIQFLLMHSLSAGSSSSEEENAVTEREKVNVEGEDEAQGMSMTKSISSRSSSSGGSSPCMHNLRGSHSLMGDEESSESALPMFLFFNSIPQRLAGNSLPTRELGFENDNDDDDDG